ncbi:hypothetical protein RI367_005350 [Sorochytrium milnesiophthora]
MAAGYESTNMFSVLEKATLLTTAPRFIVIADSNGYVHFVDAQAGTIVWSQQLRAMAANGVNGRAFSSLFFVQNNRVPGKEDLYVLQSDGLLHHFQSLDLSALAAGVKEQGKEFLRSAQGAVAVRQIDLGQQMPSVRLLTTLGMRKDELLIIGQHIRYLPLAGNDDTSAEDQAELSMEQAPAVKAQALSDRPYLLLLSQSGNLSVWHTESLLELCAIESAARDFCVVSEDYGGQIIVALVEQAEHSGQDSCVRVVALPSGRCLRQVAIRGQVWACDGALPANQTLLCCARMELWSIEETFPTQELQSLLHRHLWSEARALAARHGMSEQDVVHRKFRYLCRLPDALIDDGDVEEFQQSMTAFQDALDCADIALRLHTRTVGKSYQLVQLALAQIPRASADKEVQRTRRRCFNALERFGTFQLLCGIGNQARYVMETRAWHRFRTAMLSEEMQELLVLQDISSLVVLWRRHAHELKKTVVEALHSVQSTTFALQLVPWIRDEVLASIQSPSEKIKLMSWLAHNARAVEKAQQSPLQAHRIVQLVAQLVPSQIIANSNGTLRSDYHLAPFQFVDRICRLSGGLEQVEAEAMEDAMKLYRQIDDLVDLWKRHGLSMSLDTYSDKTPADIAFELLDRVSAPEMLNADISLHFLPYAQQHSLDPDELLNYYCLNVMNGLVSTQTGGSGETRVLTLLQSVTSADTRGDILLELMRRTGAPWSSDLEAAIQDALSQPSRRSEEITAQYRLMQLANILYTYGIRDFNLADGQHLQQIVEHIACQLRVTSSITDALQFSSVSPNIDMAKALSCRLLHCYRQNSFDHALETVQWLRQTNFRQQPGLERYEAAALVASAVEQVLRIIVRDVERSDRNEGKALVAKLDFGARLSALLTSTATPGSTHLTVTNDIAESMQTLKTLQKEFGVVHNVKEVNSEAARQQLLDTYVGKMSAHGKGSARASQQIRASFVRAAELLKIGPVGLNAAIARIAAQQGDLRTTFAMCTELVDKVQLQGGATAVLSTLVHVARYIGQLAEQALDAFICHELQGAIFERTELGRYRDQRYSLTNGVQNMEVGESAAEGSSSSASASSSSSSAPWHSGGNADSDRPVPAAISNNFGMSVFDGLYQEVGLVLESAQALSASARFVEQVSEMSASAAQHAVLYLQNRAKSKAADDQDNLSSIANALQRYLTKQQCSQPALRTLTMRSTVLTRRLISHAALTPAAAAAAAQAAQSEAKAASLLVLTYCSDLTRTRDMDHRLLLANLLSMDQQVMFKELFEWIRQSFSRYDRLLSLTNVGEAAAIAWGNHDYVVQFKLMARTGRWLQQLKLLEIPFPEAQFHTCRDGSVQRSIVPLLVQKTSRDLLTCLEFSRAYFIEDDFVLSEYIKQVLCADDDSSNQDYVNLVKSTLDSVTNRSLLAKRLMQDCLPRLPPFDYDKIRFALDTVLALADHDESEAKRCLSILHVLSHYTRAKPKAGEEQQSASPLLSFHEVRNEGWEAIKHELSLDNLSHLLLLSTPLNIPVDRFCEHIIQSLITSLNAPLTARARSVTFAMAKPVIRSFKSNTARVSACVRLADAFDPGLERLQALRFAEHLSERRLGGGSGGDVTMELDNIALSNSAIKQRIAVAETEDQLVKAKLTPYLAHLSQPALLLRELYCQLSEAVQRGQTKIDLHGLCTSIADRHGVDMDGFRSKLLEEWLLSDTNTLTDSTTEDRILPSARFQVSMLDEASQEHSLQTRLLYLLRSGSTADATRRIAQFLSSAPASSLRAKQLASSRALVVLLRYLATANALDAETMQTAKQSLRSALYAMDFEFVNVNAPALTDIGAADKLSLARSLWLANNNDPKVLQLICNIIVDFELKDRELWERCLGQLVYLREYPVLQAVVYQLLQRPTFWAYLDFPQLWNEVFVGSVAAAPDDMTNTARLIRLLQRFPYLPSLDMRHIITTCQSALAQATVPPTARLYADCALLMCLQQDNEQFMNDCLDGFDTATLLSLLDVLADGAEGNERNREHPAVASATALDSARVTRHTFAIVNRRQDYQALLGSPHLDRFIQAMITADTIEDVVRFLVAHGQTDYANTLAGLYHKHWQSAVAEVVAGPHQDLEAYLQQKSIPLLLPNGCEGGSTEEALKQSGSGPAAEEADVNLAH